LRGAEIFARFDDGKTAFFFALRVTDERKASDKLLPEDYRYNATDARRRFKNRARDSCVC
jgi:hypothetical protein